MKTYTRLLLYFVLTIGFDWSGLVARAQLWSPTDTPDQGWGRIAVSADGKKVAAAPEWGPIYLSVDGGTTWSTNNGSPSNYWGGIACSADGTKLVASGLSLTNTALIYTSQDSGQTWTQTSAPDGPYYVSIACSADGTKMVAVAELGAVYTSQDSGSNWAPALMLSTNAYWEDCACSADGHQMVAVSFAQPDGIIATSSDYGLHWSTNNDAPNEYWMGVATSADGTRMIASAGLGALYMSTNSGQHWFANTNAPSGYFWNGVASSADGSTLIATSGAYSFQQAIVLSTDSGADWNFAVAPFGDWTTASCSADGGEMFAASGHGGTSAVYEATRVVAPTLEIGSNGAAAQLSWVVPSTSFVLQESASLSAPDWENVTNTPVNTNEVTQVTLTPGAQSYFRLKH